MKTVTIKEKNYKKLYETIARLKSVKEYKMFFRDLCTLAELNAMSERLEVMNMIAKNIPYRTICEKTGASTATITRVAHWLHHGKGGYRLVLERS